MTQPKSNKSTHPGATGKAEPEQIAIAREVHTLAQMVYGQLAVTQPWVFASPAPWGPTGASAMAFPQGRSWSPPMGGAPHFHQFR
jgi:hypothetical protein